MLMRKKILSYRFSRKKSKAYPSMIESIFVYPLDETVMVFLLENGVYGKPTVYCVPDEIPVKLFQDLTIPLESVFR